MRLLLVCRNIADSVHVDDLRSVWASADITLLAAADFEASHMADYDCMAVVGAYDETITAPLDAVSALMNAMVEAEKPVLAIGWGFQLLCLAYGDDLVEVAEKLAGATKIEPTGKGEALFQGSDPLRVASTERWSLDELPRGLTALARSETGIEACMHKAKPLYGLQLFPADFTYASDAKLVYQNLLTFITKRT